MNEVAPLKAFERGGGSGRGDEGWIIWDCCHHKTSPNVGAHGTK